jgi:hypothetical protein
MLTYWFEGYAFHFLYRHTTIRTPLSFIDDFALYFANTRFCDDQMAIGRTPVNVGRFLNFLKDGHRLTTKRTSLTDHRRQKFTRQRRFFPPPPPAAIHPRIELVRCNATVSQRLSDCGDGLVITTPE